MEMGRQLAEPVPEDSKREDQVHSYQAAGKSAAIIFYIMIFSMIFLPYGNWLHICI